MRAALARGGKQAKIVFKNSRENSDCNFMCVCTHTHPFNGPFSGTTQVSCYQKGTTNLDFTEARDSEWQWNQLGHMQVCTPLQTDNHASTRPLCFLQAGCPSCRLTNSVKALKATYVCMRAIKTKHYSCTAYLSSVSWAITLGLWLRPV